MMDATLTHINEAAAAAESMTNDGASRQRSSLLLVPRLISRIDITEAMEELQISSSSSSSSSHLQVSEATTVSHSPVTLQRQWSGYIPPPPQGGVTSDHRSDHMQMSMSSSNSSTSSGDHNHRLHDSVVANPAGDVFAVPVAPIRVMGRNVIHPWQSWSVVERAGVQGEGGAEVDPASYQHLHHRHVTASVPCREPTARFGHTAVAFQDHMVIFGGRSADTYYSDVWTYRLDRHTWTPCETRGAASPSSEPPPSGFYRPQPAPTSPSPRAGHTATVLRGRWMFVVGGSTASAANDCTSDVWCLDLASTPMTWYFVDPNSPTPTGPPWRSDRNSGSSSSLHVDPVVADTSASSGGAGLVNGSSLYRRVVLSFTNHQHRSSRPRSFGLSPRKGHTTVLYHDQFLVVFGGSSGISRRDDNAVWALDLDTHRWQPMCTTGTAPAPRSYHVAEMADDQKRMFVFGGKSNAPPSSDASCFSSELYELVFMPPSAAQHQQGSALPVGLWRAIEVTGDVPSGRMCSSSVYLSGLLCVFLGGSNVYHDDCFEYNTRTHRWRRMEGTDGLQACTRPTTLLHRNTLMMFGGCSPDHGVMNTVLECRLQAPTLRELCRDWIQEGKGRGGDEATGDGVTDSNGTQRMPASPSSFSPLLAPRLDGRPSVSSSSWDDRLHELLPPLVADFVANLELLHQ